MWSLEATRLGKSAPEIECDSEPDQRDEIDEPPTGVTEVGKWQTHHCNAGAETTGHSKHADRICAAVAWHLFGCGDGDQKVERKAHRAADRLRGHQHTKVWRQGSKSREQRSQPGCEHDHPSSSGTVGHEGNRQGKHDANANDYTANTLSELADAEIFRSKVGGLREQRVGKRRAH